MPGTYFYHDHSNQNRGDGLQGALIVKERAGTPKLFEASADEVLFLQDWWHFAGNSMALRLNRFATECVFVPNPVQCVLQYHVLVCAVMKVNARLHVLLRVQQAEAAQVLWLRMLSCC
jgi:FtsP/CotA-like multicopper oxidase with cupredoxin domain